MKSITKILAKLMMLLITISLQAQTTSSSSSKSSSTTSIHSDSDDDNSSYSYSRSSKDKSKNNNVSVSISSSDDSYTLHAKFPEEKHREIKDLLTKEMSSKNYTLSKGKDNWNSDSNGEEVYKVNLSKVKLTMSLDKNIASSSLAKKIEALGLTIRTIIVGEQNEARRDAERMQRQADRLRRDAEQMQREANRMQREAQRQVARNSSQYRDEAKKIANEARRLAVKASYLNVEAAHKGAISSLVRQLLRDSKTTYNDNTKNSFNWTWPEAQNELLGAFKKDNLIDTKNDVVFIKDATGIYVNGKHLPRGKIAKYNSILTKYSISKTHYLTFYKTNNHIVLVNDNANLEGFIDTAISKDILDSASREVKLSLNGATAYKNGSEVSVAVLKTLNDALLQNNIIPAPGKVFEIIKSKNYKLGYSVGDKTHLGTWQM
ncbi:hypothetical protein [Lacinutrix jangbogonensis]|uniref:hypothetical protein n=1 Tax=Lacinutrix jangbogonensis TaxID=1469557 RepID=UPI00053E6289|nr:hypothetical protein [Lacinutrix jangbogonensis]